MKPKLGCDHPGIHGLRLVYVAIHQLQGEALEKRSAKLLSFALGHKWTLKSGERLCVEELLKIQLQQGVEALSSSPPYAASSSLQVSEVQQC